MLKNIVNEKNTYGSFMTSSVKRLVMVTEKYQVDGRAQSQNFIIYPKTNIFHNIITKHHVQSKI